MTALPPCEDPTPGPRAVVPPALLETDVHLTALAQRIQLALSVTGHPLPRDLAAARDITLAIGYEVFGLDPNAAESEHRLSFYADLVVRHREEVTAHVAPF